MIITGTLEAENRMDIMEGVFPYEELEYVVLYREDIENIGWISFLKPFEVLIFLLLIDYLISNGIEYSKLCQC